MWRFMLSVQMLVTMLGLGSAAWGQNWSENFESYANGQVLYNVNGWSGWNNVQGVAGSCTTQQAHGGSKSILIQPNDDAIRTFESGYNVGRGTMRAWMYLARAQHTADTYYIVQNEYTHGGPYQWCIELQFDITTQTVLDDFRDESGVVNIIYDRWVELRFEIDIDNDFITCYYNNQEVSSGQLFIRGGNAQIKNLDLYSTGSTNYFDDLAVTGLHSYELLPWPFLQIEGPCPGVMTFRVSHASPGGMVAFIYGLQEGMFRIPNGRLCAGTEIGISDPRVARTVRADQNGVAVLSGAVQGGFCDQVFMQGLDLNTCAGSGVELVSQQTGRETRCIYTIDCRLENDGGDCAAPVRRLVQDLDPAARFVYTILCRRSNLNCPSVLFYKLRVYYRVNGGELQDCTMDVRLVARDPEQRCVRPIPRPFTGRLGPQPSDCGPW
ncbi:MAG: hypothetical protein KJZ69_17100 [Phycisphaerales bacterium]|nr:hypothetical protein [Phycisphaerales bacterium]